MSFYKKDCINVNGFNNDFEGWGREDSEFVIRLMNNGIKRNNIRFCAIQYHLWHKENDRTEIYRNNLMLKNAINNRTKWCENGLTSLNSNES
mgnify:FL=1